MSKEVVHVHDLAPSLLVSDLVLVFQVAYDFCVARKFPDESATIGGCISDGGGHFHVPLSIPIHAEV